MTEIVFIFLAIVICSVVRSVSVQISVLIWCGKRQRETEDLRRALIEAVRVSIHAFIKCHVRVKLLDDAWLCMPAFLIFASEAIRIVKDSGKVMLTDQVDPHLGHAIAKLHKNSLRALICSVVGRRCMTDVIAGALATIAVVSIVLHLD
jgi:hypothetical protein